MTENELDRKKMVEHKPTPKQPQPMQPVVLDKAGCARFQCNAIVKWMLDAGRRGDRFDMNTLADIPADTEDFQQFAQLIGYSVSGYGELSYVTDESYVKAQRIADKLPKAEGRA